MRNAGAEPQLYKAPDRRRGRRRSGFAGLLMLTCTGVSFAHGSNDGQKGMGLIMLILIGTVPTAYALNHAVTAHDSQDFVAVSVGRVAGDEQLRHAGRDDAADPREGVTAYVRSRTIAPDDHRLDLGAHGGRRPGHGTLQGVEGGPRRPDPQLSQRHVPGGRGVALHGEVAASRRSRRPTPRCSRTTTSTSTKRPSSSRRGSRSRSRSRWAWAR